MSHQPPPVARIYPAPFPERLHFAGLRGDMDEINRVVDELHKRGFCEARCLGDPLQAAKPEPAREVA